ncbi:hypothetical protein ACFX1X_041762 [Malus domestica]
MDEDVPPAGGSSAGPKMEEVDVAVFVEPRCQLGFSEAPLRVGGTEWPAAMPLKLTFTCARGLHGSQE